jgi:hypothetical protein
LALATKYSGVLLAPALAVAVWLGDGPPRSVSRAALRFGAVVAVGGALLWLSYLPVNRSYSSEIGRDAIRELPEPFDQVVDDRMRAHEPLLSWSGVTAAARWWTASAATASRIGVYRRSCWED